MPNTRADLERLKHHWEQGTCAWDDTYADELLAMAERLLTERTDARDHACKAIATAMGAREVLGAVSAGIRSMLLLYEPGQGGPVDREALLSDLAALFNPEGTNEDG